MAFSLNNGNILYSTSSTAFVYPFSLVGWFRVPDVTAPVPLMGLTNFASGESCDVFFVGNGAKEAAAQTKTSGSLGVAYSTSPMIPGQWHHLVAVFASDSERKIYLDGGSLGVNSDNLPISAMNFLYFGNPSSPDPAHVADVSFLQAVVSAEQAATLAGGGAVLASPNFHDVVAYHDCIRQTNRPGLGPKFTVVGTPTVVEHPRTMFAVGGYSTAIPDRVRGPWRVEQSHARSLAADQGQSSVAGVASNNSILSGEVTS